LSFSVLFKSSPLRGGFFIFQVSAKLSKNYGTQKRDLTAPLTFILSRGGREGGKENDFNGTSHFNYFSLGKKVKKISSRASSPLTGEDRGGGEKINSTPHPDPLPQSGEGRKGKDLTALLLLFSPARGEKKEDERKRMTLMTPLTFVLSRKVAVS
jgi:hypothetical protein